MRAEITAEDIRAFRRKKGWTQEQMGMRLGVEAGAVSKWELGHPPNSINRAKLRELRGNQLAVVDPPKAPATKPQALGIESALATLAAAEAQFAVALQLLATAKQQIQSLRGAN